MKIKVDTSVLDALRQRAPALIEEALDEAAQGIVDDIKESFGTGPGGRSYPRGRKMHIASRAGFPPNVDTGALRASMNWRRTGRFKRTIADGVPYGVYLELGVGMAKRPFVRPVLEAWAREKIGRILAAKLKRLK